MGLLRWTHRAEGRRRRSERGGPLRNNTQLSSQFDLVTRTAASHAQLPCAQTARACVPTQTEWLSRP